MPARVAVHPDETVGQDAAAEEQPEGALDEPGDDAVAAPGAGQERFDVLPDDAVEDGCLRSASLVGAFGCESAGLAARSRHAGDGLREGCRAEGGAGQAWGGPQAAQRLRFAVRSTARRAICATPRPPRFVTGSVDLVRLRTGSGRIPPAWTRAGFPPRPLPQALGLEELRTALPFRLQGLDADNGSEGGASRRVPKQLTHKP